MAFPSDDYRMVVGLPTESLSQIFEKFIENKVQGIPIVDANSKPIYVVELLDIIDLLTTKFPELSFHQDVYHKFLHFMKNEISIKNKTIEQLIAEKSLKSHHDPIINEVRYFASDNQLKKCKMKKSVRATFFGSKDNGCK